MRQISCKGAAGSICKMDFELPEHLVEPLTRKICARIKHPETRPGPRDGTPITMAEAVAMMNECKRCADLPGPITPAHVRGLVAAEPRLGIEWVKDHSGWEEEMITCRASRSQQREMRRR